MEQRAGHADGCIGRLEHRLPVGAAERIRRLAASGSARGAERLGERRGLAADDGRKLLDGRGSAHGTGIEAAGVVGERPAQAVDALVEDREGDAAGLVEDRARELRVADQLVAEPVAVLVDEHRTVHHRRPRQEHAVRVRDAAVPLIGVEKADVCAEPGADRERVAGAAVAAEVEAARDFGKVRLHELGSGAEAARREHDRARLDRLGSAVRPRDVRPRDGTFRVELDAREPHRHDELDPRPLGGRLEQPAMQGGTGAVPDGVAA